MMAMVLLLGLVLGLVLSVVFTAQNTEVVTLSLLLWHIDASLAAIMVACLAVGLVLGVSMLAPKLYRSHNSTRRLARRLTELEAVDSKRPSAGSAAPRSAMINPDGHA